jgi:twitching motility protein PilT
VLLEEWIGKAHALGASDLHLETDTAVVARIRGELQTVGGAIAGERLLQSGQDLLGADGWAQFKARGSADISLAIAGTRCRASLFQTVRGIAFAIRLLAPTIKDLRACNLHTDFRKLIEAPSGLVLISGPTGAGKSTTLAALIEEINSSRARNIVTLESPLEYLFSNRRAFIRQREIPAHSPSFEQGIVDALRENPDVLVISEMRTPEVMRLTLNAAETGHLVLATIHSASCSEALSRLCNSFPAEIQGSIRAQLADCLVGVSCQRLEFLSAQRLSVPRCELLLASSGARGAIRSGNFSQLANVLQSGAEEGMWSFDRYHRWIEQVSDWARPVPLPAERHSSDYKGVGFVSHAPIAKPAPAVKSRVSTARPIMATGEDVIEVPAEEMGLAELAELARKVAERKT